MSKHGLNRLDKELVRRKIARSREEARVLIEQGAVTVAGMQAKKPATQVTADVSIAISEQGPQWASRGAHKLLGALEAFSDQGLSVSGCKVLDAGASTGGFTDVLLAHDAREVVAVDVGYGQLLQRLANDPRVTVLDRTNVRTLTPQQCGGPCDMMVGDLSFISLTLVLPAIIACLRDGAHLLPMVKPQFEVGKQDLPKGAVVSDPAMRARVVTDVAYQACALGLTFHGCVASPLPGPAGNVEYFLWLEHTKPKQPVDRATIAQAVEAAVAAGPK
ncbi:TlyA family RNA methyltransferase [Corynebacterium choanae]|uniref:16S/23S rRNA (Cytidine-2'-O)-methyltransferase TlyA n=1 Tax=Corynebacterium choanae TaxID=1862358 RepID=A0A3G6J6U2_9CORY|nr:TlyA family RNA methyltransferase [Corynebacterium choanae]AZA13483.1 16S/23S rRNA (cytidine-2'-O)-methyltransferase TlyA [Corynebacterium choanae]